ncbi:MAG: glycerophosphodiester phosphodiesterase, partial [Flavobacteriales bacterium]
GWSPENFLISSFKWDELREMRHINPDVAIAVLTDGDPLEALPIAKELGAEAINPDFRTLNREVADKIHDEGFKIYTWTVNEPSEIGSVKELSVDGIITNYPERVH